MKEEENKESFKVLDKRRFTTDGEERGDTPVSHIKETSSTEPAKDQLNEENKNSEFILKSEQNNSGLGPELNHELDSDTVNSYNADPKENLTGLFISLANQAMWCLGLIEPPEGVEVTKDLVAARELIDILSSLQVKTKGNLDEVENKLLTEILHNLRMHFISAAK